MGAAYKLRLKSAAGILVAEITDFIPICYNKHVNYPGMASFTLNGDHSAIALLENRSQVEIWRSNEKLGIDWYCDFYGLYLDQDRNYTDMPTFTANCPGQMWFLDTRIAAWYAETADRTDFTVEKAETIMKTLVDYNCCANATVVNGRIREGAITGLSIQADGSNGNTIDWRCAWKRVLPELQAIARVGGGDFDLIKTGAQTWEFRWYTGQRGTDRSATILFALHKGNMANPRYRYKRIGEKTVAIVGGEGEAAARETVVRTGTDYSATNDVEIFVDARRYKETAGYNSAGDKKLDEKQARDDFIFDVIQTPSCLYGDIAAGGHYELGDLVKSRAFGIEKTQKFVGVTVVFDKLGNETIDMETEIQ